VRDFIHVVDLCRAHLLALEALRKGIKNHVFNLGNGNGFSVLDVIKVASGVAGKPVPHSIGPRRPGDVAIVVASSEKARKILGWKPQYNLDEILKSEWERRL
jgi:UDP-glucose 4-epimerase